MNESVLSDNINKSDIKMNLLKTLYKLNTLDICDPESF